MAAAQGYQNDLGPAFAAAVDGVGRGELDELDLSCGHIGDSGVAQLAQQIRQARPEAPTLRALTPLAVHRIKSPICSARSRSWSRGPSWPLEAPKGS